MKTPGVRMLVGLWVIITWFLVIGCGGSVSSEQGVQAMELIDEYDGIIARYEYNLKEAVGNPGKIAQLIDNLEKEQAAWFEKWNDTYDMSSLDPGESITIEKRITRLNKRVEKINRRDLRERVGREAPRRYGRVIDEF